jgi:DNA adenine methylase
VWEVKYLGSKNRIAKHLLPIMLKERGNRVWVEPFVGGANMIDKVTEGERIGNDSNKYLIALLKAVQNGWIPPRSVSKEMYYDVKNNQGVYPDEVVGFIGFLCSFSGKWWGGYANDKKTGRNFADEGSRNLVKQAKNLNRITFVCGNYLEMDIPPNSLIYCDPPYKGATKYYCDFDHIVFWNWCREKVKEGYIVFVSEYSAPDDFICVKEINHITTVNNNNVYQRTDKLFKGV